MFEEPVELTSGGRRLVACLHHAAEPAAGLFVLCHSLAEERKCAAAAVVGLARALAASGRHVLRFDYRGCGDSPGDFSDFSLEDWREDARAALRLGRDLAGEGLPLGIFGVRLGVFPALAAAGDGVRHLVLWEPLSGGAAYLEEVKRRRLLRGSMTGNRPVSGTADEGFDNEGFYFSAELCRQLAGLDLAEELRRSAASETLLLQVSPGRPLYAALEGSGRRVLQVAGPPFWQRIGVSDVSPQTTASLAWLEESSGQANRIVGGRENGSADVPEQELEDGERLVSFSSSGDGRLRGVLHLPDETTSRPGVVLLHGWGGCRLGEHRSLLSLARRLSAGGRPALRFDFRGRGESDGLPEETTMESMAEDALAAVEFLRRRTGVSRVFLVGTCSGARIGLRVAVRAGAAGLVGWSMPAPDEVAQLPRAVRRTRFALAEYGRKLLRPQTWRKLVQGRLQPRLIAEALFGRGRGDSRPAGAMPERTLLIYGGADPETPAAADHYRRRAAENGAELSLESIEGANHGFYALEWQEEILSKTVDWIASHE